MSDVRLIDANAVVTIQVFDEMTEEYYMETITVAKVIDRWSDEGCPPTIDAVPVVHGRWLTSSYIPDTLICSVCGKRFDMYHYDQKDMPFCLCGAKMDGGDNE